MPAPMKIRNLPTGEDAAGQAPQEVQDDATPAHVPSGAAPSGGAPGAKDPLDDLRAFLEKQKPAAAPTPVIPRPIDPAVFQQAQRSLQQAAGIHALTSVHTPNWYEIQHGKGPVDMDPEGSRMIEQAAQMPLEQAKYMRGMDVETAKVLNDFAEKNANRENAFDVGKMHAGAAAAMVPVRTAASVEAAKQKAPIEVQKAVDTANATAPTKVQTATKIAAATAPIKVEAGKAKIPGAEATNVNKAEEVINRAQQAKELLHKYGNLGPLIQYGTAPAAALRALHMDAPIKDSTGRQVPPDELSNDANELQGHITYLTKEAPRVLAAGGRMDLNSIKALGHTFPGATDSEESGTKKLDMYGHHAYEWIRKTDAAHAGAVRRDIYGGGQLPGEERYGGEATPTGGSERKQINGKWYVKKPDGWEEE